tara:strand:+ start:780 stop:1082 length:303 start_codon:yes stop_codon:yes gene_type:complete
MRKITQEAIRAFTHRKNFKKANTQVMAHSDGWTGLFLHGNLIAEIENHQLIINDGGWQSNTTKDRLNGLPHVHIQQKNFQWYLNGEGWNGEKINVCKMIY